MTEIKRSFKKKEQPSRPLPEKYKFPDPITPGVYTAMMEQIEDITKWGEKCERKQSRNGTELCVLTLDRCRYARCPYAPGKRIIIDEPQPDGIIYRRTIGKRGTIENIKFLNDDVRKRYDARESKVAAFYKDEIAGKPCKTCPNSLTVEDAWASSGEHCAACYDKVCEGEIDYATGRPIPEGERP